MIQMGTGGGEVARWSSVVSEAVGMIRRSSECKGKGALRLRGSW